MPSGVDSHRVEIHEEEKDQPFHEKKEAAASRQNAAGQFYPFAYPFCPPPYYQPWVPGPQSMPPPQQVADPRAQCAPQMMQMPHQYYQGQLPGGHHPQYLAVNVHTDNHQHQNQKGEVRNASKQISVKEKIVKNVSRGLEHLLDSRVLIAGLTAFVLPKIAQHLQQTQHKKKKRELFLRFGFA